MIFELFARERAAGRPLVAAIVIDPQADGERLARNNGRLLGNELNFKTGLGMRGKGAGAKGKECQPPAANGERRTENHGQ